MSHSPTRVPIVRSTEFRLGAFASRAARKRSLHVAMFFCGPGALGRWSSDRLTGSTRIRCELVTVRAGANVIALLQILVEGVDRYRRVRELVRGAIARVFARAAALGTR